MNGKEFKIYKFRSMYKDAEKHTGPVWSTKDDPRVTRVGKIMRKLRIDEIPQFFNVLNGEMSLVGPRPERPYFVERLAQQLPYYKRRLKVRPGITGWAQVKHKYDESIEDVNAGLGLQQTSGGQFLRPPAALLKVGSGEPFFYCAGDFSLDVPRGLTQVLVERGTEYRPAKASVYAPESGALALEIPLERWAGLGDAGWHPGNTHIHYDDKESRPDERLRLDPRVEDLRRPGCTATRAHQARIAG